MRQRVAFLRTFVAGKEVLLLDEPFGALDAITRAEAQDWLHTTLEAEPRTVVLVTHDVEEALLLSHEIIVLTGRPGRVAARRVVDLPAASTRRDLLATPEFVRLRSQVLADLEQPPCAPRPAGMPGGRRPRVEPTDGSRGVGRASRAAVHLDGGSGPVRPAEG
jgi:NitT/TauT family transport system ATP-binding protein